MPRKHLAASLRSYPTIDRRFCWVVSTNNFQKISQHSIGCGKGRVLCFFATYGVAKCMGIEISGTLANEAIANTQSLRFRHGAIEVTTADAVGADIGDASVIVMYNPFSAEVMLPVLDHIRDSLTASPRGLLICYANPVQGMLLDNCPWLVAVDEFVVTQNGWHACPVRIWSALDRLH